MFKSFGHPMTKCYSIAIHLDNIFTLLQCLLENRECQESVSSNHRLRNDILSNLTKK